MANTEKKEAQAIARYVRTAPLKMRRILNLIRGKTTAEALVILKVLPHKAARLTEKVLSSAIANAGTNHKLNKDKLVVAKALADQAFILKRFRAQSRGRAVSVNKRMSHITISVREKE